MKKRSKVSLSKLTFHKLDWLEYITIILSIWFFIHPKLYIILFVVLLCIPILGLVLNGLNGRPSIASLVDVSEDRSGNDKYDVADFIDFAALAILGRIFQDYSFESFYSLIIPGAVAFCIMLIVLFATHKLIEATTKSRTWIYCSLLFNILLYSYAGTYGINCVFDNSEPSAYDVEVVDMFEKTSSKGYRTYYIEVTPWGHHYDKEKLRISYSEYEDIEIGETIEIDVKEGLLGIPWFYIER